MGISQNFSTKKHKKYDSDDVLIIERNGQVKYFKDNKLNKMEVCENALYDKVLMCASHFMIDGDFLVLEGKKRVYRFTGRLTKYFVFKRVEL